MYRTLQNDRNTISVCDLIMRTTSSVESFNKVLKVKCSLHPHLFKFINQMKMIEFKKALEMISLVECGDTNAYQNKKAVEHDEKIRYFTAMLMKKKISVKCFFQAMANKTILPNTGEFSKYFFYFLLLLLK